MNIWICVYVYIHVCFYKYIIHMYILLHVKITWENFFNKTN